METPAAFSRNLAQQLLAIEAARNSDTDPRVHEAVRVCEKLQVFVTRFAGADGFTSLLRRALALARAEIPAIQTVQWKSDCPWEELLAKVASTTHGDADAPALVVAHLLGLLVTLIGEPLTLRMVREAWPDELLEG